MTTYRAIFIWQRAVFNFRPLVRYILPKVRRIKRGGRNE